MIVRKIAAVLAAALAVSAVTVTAFADSKGIGINEKNFPDEVFRGYVSDNFDTDKNGYLSKDERKAVTEINVGYKWEKYDWENLVRSVKGIEYFPRLKKIDCTECYLESIDVSKNKRLTHLMCRGSVFTELDVSNNAKLKRLECDRADKTGPGGIKHLDLKNNAGLEELWCFSNRLTKLDVSGCPELTELNCAYNKLTELNVKSCPELEKIRCASNELTELDVSGCKDGIDFNCDSGVKIIE